MDHNYKKESCDFLKQKDILIIGKVFNRLTVLAFSGRDKRGEMRYICQCSCGKVINTPTRYKMEMGHTKSCGCLKKEVMSNNMSKYKNKGRKVEYNCWRNMKIRCTDTNNSKYSRYGGRGITVCDRWLESFDNFYDDMGESPFKGANLDRIDNNKGYSPDNCRWVTPFENIMNRECSYDIDVNVYERPTGFYTQIIRSKNKKRYKRISYTLATKEKARELRDFWIGEFNENPNKWFDDTINEVYKKELKNL